MAPHDTDPKKEARRHATPLIVLTVILALVALMILFFLGYLVKEPDTGAAEPKEPAVEAVE